MLNLIPSRPLDLRGHPRQHLVNPIQLPVGRDEEAAVVPAEPSMKELLGARGDPDLDMLG
jgi:hypothetical protein